MHDRFDAKNKVAIKRQRWKNGKTRTREERIGGIFDEQLFHVFKNANGFDRLRMGPNALDARFLRTNAAKDLISLERGLNGCVESEGGIA